MSIISLSFFLMLSLPACPPKVSVGIGGATVSENNSMSASEVYADSETGIHDNIMMGKYIRL